MRSQSKRSLIFPLATMTVLLLLPDALFAAEDGGNRWGVWLFEFGKLFNLALVIGVLVWAARKPMANFLASRSQMIRDQLEEAQKAKREAEEKLAEIESRMGRLDDEIGELKAAAESEAQREYERLMVEAEQDAKKIVERARQEIDGMTRAAHIELRDHATELSLKLAEAKIKSEITDEDRDRLFDRFVREIGNKK